MKRAEVIRRLKDGERIRVTFPNNARFYDGGGGTVNIATFNQLSRDGHLEQCGEDRGKLYRLKAKNDEYRGLNPKTLNG